MEFHFTQEKEEIFPDIFVLGDIPAVVPEEPEDGMFFLKAGETTIADRMRDEQLLVVRTPKGLAVFVGCAHAGILNGLRKVGGAFPGEPIYCLLAGMHLRGCGRERVDATIEGLARYGITWLIPVHCTGMEAIVRMREAFGKSCLPGEAGRQFEL